MTIEDQMRILAEQFHVKPTQNLPKIANARKIMNIDINICPCARDDEDRGCISAKCLREIREKGVCHCNAYERINDVK